MPAAAWWNNPGAKDDKPVVAHTPDDTQYHYPDERQMERMRGGVTMGVIVPRANDDGTSKGFDGRVAGVVHVDPDAPDGGAVVDLSQVDPTVYGQAFQQSTFPHEVFYRLGQSPSPGMMKVAKAQPRPASRANSLVPPGSYIVPAADEDGTQQVYTLPSEVEMKPIPPLPRMGHTSADPYARQAPAQEPAQAHFQTPATPVPGPVASLASGPAPAPAMSYTPSQMPQGAAYPYPQQVPMPMAIAPPPNLDHLYSAMNQLSEQVRQLAGQVQQQQEVMLPPPAHPQLRTMPSVPAPRPLHSRRPPQPSEPARPIPRHASEEDESEDDYTPHQTIQQVQDAARESVAEGVVMGFETLDMPFVKGPLPERPKREVFFTLGDLGAMGARYHAVQATTDCVALVYDTRYVDGQQFLPPNLGSRRIEVAINRVKKGKRVVERHICSSLGIHFAVGVLDIIVLIKHSEEEQSEDVEDEEAED